MALFDPVTQGEGDVAAHPNSGMGPVASGDMTYLAAATAIGDALVASAIPAAEGVAWESDDLVGTTESDATVVHGRVGPDLYAGAAGIAWFLGHLSACVGSPRMADVARAGMAYALAEIRGRLLDEAQLSLYGGATGVALAAVEVADALQDSRLRRSGFAAAENIVAVLRRGAGPAETDLIGGMAGVVVGLLAIHRRHPRGWLLDGCRAACEQLTHEPHHDWWNASPDGGGATAPPLCGLGHGASGIAWALCEARWAVGDPPPSREDETAEEALAYERAWFSPEHCAWPDLRQPSQAALDDGRWPAWMSAWCHGAIGIGAVRWRIYEETRDVAALAEAGAAIQAARLMTARAGADLANGQVTDVTLCHGLGGATELLLLAHEVSGLADHQRAARRVGNLCLAMHAANGRRWPIGLRGAETVPGLQVGVAGIGVTMMRLHDASLVGSPILPGRAPFACAARRRLNKRTARRRARRSAHR